jgi:pentatricopeptide repeat protein
MRAEGVTPNLVTYNTLIDVYGKTGQWEEAVRVLDTLEEEVSLRQWADGLLLRPEDREPAAGQPGFF